MGMGLMVYRNVRRYFVNGKGFNGAHTHKKELLNGVHKHKKAFCEWEWI